MSKNSIMVAPKNLLVQLRHGFEGTQEAKAFELYWLVEDGHYVHTIKQVGNILGIKATAVAAKAHKAGMVSTYSCDRCRRPLFYNEAPTRDSVRDKWYDHDKQHYCSPCRAIVAHEQAEARQAAEEQERERKHQLYLQDSRKADENAERGTYESLNDLEFNYLLALRDGDTLHTAAKTVGVSPKTADAIFQRFLDLHILACDGRVFYYPTVLKNALRSEEFRTKAKSVFGSPKAMELYRALKKQHAMVFPEVGLAAFVNKDAISHLLDEGWKTSYFLSARVDFLICRRDGTPFCVYEYDGGYHNLEEQRRKDRFKDEILEAVDVPVQRITGSTLGTV